MEQYYTHYTTKNSTIVSSQKYTSVDRHYGPPVQSPLLAYTNSTNQLPRDQDATGLKAKHNVIMILYMLKIILNLVCINYSNTEQYYNSSTLICLLS